MAARFAASETTASLVPTITSPTTEVTSTMSSFANSTSSYFNMPTSKDLVLLPVRYVYRAERYLFGTLPRQFAHTLRIDRLAESFVRNFMLDQGAEGVAGAAGQAADLVAEQAGEGWSGALQEAFGFHNVRSFGGMLSYMTSRWSIACFAMALLLNRVSVYAASRQRISLTWDKRLALRMVPILLFVGQIHSILQAIRCQTSPDWSLQRYGKTGKQPALDWSSNGGPLYQLSSTALFWEDDTTACVAVGMSKPGLNRTAPYGSFSLLWPTFLRLCLSHFVETFSSALQQRPVMTETGMSVFEHSLAFAEAEAMIGHSMGLSIFGAPKPGSSAANRTAEIVRDAAIDPDSSTRPFVLDRVNVPAEVLLIALISCCNSLTANIIAVFNKQHKLRLINTAFWGISFMTAFTWGFFNYPATSNTGDVSSGLLRFPTVCIVGFIPHLSIIIGMVVCGCIYALALTLTAVSLGTNPAIPHPTSLRERFQIAHENLQAAIQVKGFEIRWSEDFYSALLRVGFAVLSAASEAVFLNEGRAVEVRRYTWIEEERLDELDLAQGRGRPAATSYTIQEEYGYPASSEAAPYESGYGKERKVDDTKNKSRGDDLSMNRGPAGVGAIQRTTRFWSLFVFLKSIYFLLTGWIAYGIGRAFDYVGITFRPRWLRGLIGKSLKRSTERQEREREARAHAYALDFWLLENSGQLRTPRNEAYDIEPEMRRRIRQEHEGSERRLERKLDQRLYEWWKRGGWWGSEDFSGEFRPTPDDNEDTTSVLSMSTDISITTTEDERDWESLSSGQVTPTQADFTRESTPFSDPDLTPMDTASLAKLLNPRDPASRSEARILSSHLSAPERRVITRSQYRQELEQERSRVLLAGRRPPYPGPSQATKPTGEEESEILEKLIIDRRTSQQPHNHTAEDDGRPSGPLCVVCQASPRTIIAWPCRCLCVCEDCRVSLAMNNFGSCVTCRRDVGGFVRLWVP